jgi:AcrR family transcriptional regulator
VTEGVKRQYRLAARADRAAATRTAIRDAAAALFLEQGFTTTTMKQVARSAGVGERTLYDAFPTKVDLFHHVAGVAIVGDEIAVAAADRPEFLALLQEHDLRRAATMYAAYVTALLDRAGALIMVAVESSGADPALRRFSEEGSAATKQNIRGFVRGLVERGALAVVPDDAADALFALSSPHVHHLLRAESGWTSERYRHWLTRATLEELGMAAEPRSG